MYRSKHNATDKERAPLEIEGKGLKLEKSGKTQEKFDYNLAASKFNLKWFT